MARRATRLAGGRRVGLTVDCTEKYWHSPAARCSRGALPRMASRGFRFRSGFDGSGQPTRQAVKAVVPALCVHIARLVRKEPFVSQLEIGDVAPCDQVDRDDGV